MHAQVSADLGQALHMTLGQSRSFTAVFQRFHCEALEIPYLGPGVGPISRHAIPIHGANDQEVRERKERRWIGRFQGAAGIACRANE